MAECDRKGFFPRTGLTRRSPAKISDAFEPHVDILGSGLHVAALGWLGEPRSRRIKKGIDDLFPTGNRLVRADSLTIRCRSTVRMTDINMDHLPRTIPWRSQF